MSNPALVPLLAGVLIGWVSYFLVDLFFLRRPKPDPRIPELEAVVQRCGDDLRAAATKRDSLQADLDMAVSARNRVEVDLQARQQELVDCRSRSNQLAADLKTRDGKLADLAAQLGTLQTSLAAATSARANVEAELALRDQKLAEAQAGLHRRPADRFDHCSRAAARCAGFNGANRPRRAVKYHFDRAKSQERKEDPA